MPQLETILRGLAKAGELSYISLVPVAGNGNGGVVFHAWYRPASSKHRPGEARDADPAKALLAAISAVKIKTVDTDVDELLS